MQTTLRVAVSLLVALLAGALLTAGGPAYAAQTAGPGATVTTGTLSTLPGPPLRTPQPALDGAFSCNGDLRGEGRPVLLVHGTGSEPRESWGPVYLPLFEAAGRTVCTVALPERATGDMQVSVEYLVHAVRRMAAEHGGPVDLLGHSQGATLSVLALKYWPDLPGLLENVIGLAPTFTPSSSGAALCTVPCSAPFQQRLEDSVYFQNFRAHPLPTGPSITTIATRQDEVASPAPEASRLEGATNIVVQDTCPMKVVDHFGLLTDGAVYAFVVDGLDNPGPVDPTRVDPAVCSQTFPPGVDPATVAALAAQAVANDLVANAMAEKLDEEPPVRCWVRADCADVDDRGRLLQEMTATPDGDSVQVTLRTQAPGLVRLALGDTTRDVAVAVGDTAVTLPRAAGDLTAATSTDFYRVSATEATLQLSPTARSGAPVAGRQQVAATAPGTGTAPRSGSSLAATGPGAGWALAGLVLVAGALVGRLPRPSGGS